MDVTLGKLAALRERQILQILSEADRLYTYKDIGIEMKPPNTLIASSMEDLVYYGLVNCVESSIINSFYAISDKGRQFLKDTEASS